MIESEQIESISFSIDEWTVIFNAVRLADAIYSLLDQKQNVEKVRAINGQIASVLRVARQGM
jgi:hypothetical protein